MKIIWPWSCQIWSVQPSSQLFHHCWSIFTSGWHRKTTSQQPEPRRYTSLIGARVLCTRLSSPTPVYTRLWATLHNNLEPLKHVEGELLSQPTQFFIRPNQPWPKRRTKPRPGQTRGLQFPHVTPTTAAQFRHKACVLTPPSIKRTAAPFIVFLGFYDCSILCLSKRFTVSQKRSAGSLFDFWVSSRFSCFERRFWVI